MASFCRGVCVDAGFKGATARRMDSQAKPRPPGLPAVTSASWSSLGSTKQQHRRHGTSSCFLPLGRPRLFYNGAGNWDRVLLCSPSCCWTHNNLPTSASRKLGFTGTYHHTLVVGLLLLTWSFFYQIGDIIVEWSVILRNIFRSCHWGGGLKFVKKKAKATISWEAVKVFRAGKCKVPITEENATYPLL